MDLDKAGPIPPALAEAVQVIRAQLEQGEAEAAEKSALELLENLSIGPHVFLLLSEAARLRGDTTAALDFLRNACFLDASHPELLAETLHTLIDADRPHDARDLILRYHQKEELPQILSSLGAEVQHKETLDTVLNLVGLPGSKLAKVLEGEPLPAVPNVSFDEIERRMADSTNLALDKPAESLLLELPTPEIPEVPEGTATNVSQGSTRRESLLPAKTPFINTPNHFLALKTACPGLAQYLLPLPPTWNVPRTDKLMSQAAAAIVKAVNFMEAVHYRGIWPSSFNVSGLESPEQAVERKPSDLAWELAEPGFARVVLATLLPGYEASRHIVALKHAVRSAKALAAHQNRLGGWAKTYYVRQDVGRGVPVGEPANAVWIGSDCTCTSLCLLVAAAQQIEAPMITTAAMRTVQGILQSQNPDGSWPMVWVEHEKTRAEMEGHYGKACLLDHVMDNAMRVLALTRYALHRVDVVPSMVAGTQWLLRHQQADKTPGWLASYDAGGQAGPHGHFVSLTATLSAIDALCFGAAVCDTTQCVEAAQRALHWAESFERSTKPIPDEYEPSTGKPRSGQIRMLTPAQFQEELIYLRRRLYEDCALQPPIPENIMRGRILHDAEEMCSLVAGIVQHQHKCGAWADAKGRFVTSGSYVWTLAQFILGEEAGIGQLSVEVGRRTHWQDFVLPDRQWLRVGREG